MITKRKKLLYCLCIGTLLLLVACGSVATQGGEQTVAETSTGEVTSAELPLEQSTATVQPFDFGAIVAGTPMQWMDSSTFVYVPAGEFSMGQDEQDPSDHSPTHSVTLSAFWIQQAEVTNQMYAVCVDVGVCTPPTPIAGVPNGYGLPEYVNKPVLGVDWNQAQTYCEWIQGSLPTEAQWEKAARGEDGRTYPWGEDEPNCGFLNYRACLRPSAPQLIRSYPLGASPYNVADAAGNAAEWVNDWYGEDYYTVSPGADPAGPDTGTRRVVRGSSFLSAYEDLAIVLRGALEPDQIQQDIGFRCVLSEETVANPGYPVCQTLSYSPVPPQLGPGQQFAPPPDASGDGYCIDQGGSTWGVILIHLVPPADANNVIVDSPNGDINCSSNNNNLQLLTCTGTAINPGGSTSIGVCMPSIPQVVPAPACPVLYHYNQNTGMCEYQLMGLVQCQAPNVVVPGYGCLPAPAQNDCPAGFYSATYNNQPVCVPAGGAQCFQPGICAATCPEGLVFNQSQFCCEYPQDVIPVCPSGYIFDSMSNSCLSNQQAINCIGLDISVPSCPTPIPDTGCWISSQNPSGATVTHCVIPCPANEPNNGPCP